MREDLIILACKFSRFLVLLLSFSLLGGCFDESSEEKEDVQKTPIGDFLAGQYALNHGDPRDASAFFESGLENATKDPHILAAYLKALVLQENFSEAVKVAEKLNRLNPKNFLSHLTLLVADIKANRTRYALDRLKALEQFYAFHTMKPFVEAWLHVFNGRTKKALKLLHPFVEEEGHLYPRYRFHTALVFHHLNLHQQAFEHGQKVVNLKDQAPSRMLKRLYIIENTKLRKIIATLLRHHKTPIFIRAKHLENKRELNDCMAEIFLDFAIQFTQEGNGETGLIFAKYASFLMPLSTYKNFVMGDIYLNLKKDARAKKAFKKIGTVSSYYPLAQFRLADILGREEELDEAITILKTLRKAHPMWAQIYLEEAQLLTQKEALKEAMILLNAGIGRFEGSLKAPCYYKRSFVYEQLGQFQDQENDLREALALTPDDPYVLNYLAFIQAERNLDAEEGLLLALKAVKLLPHDGVLLDTLGWIYHRLSQNERAVITLEKAHKLAPEDVKIAEHLGDVYMALERQKDARFMYEKAFDMATEPEVKNRLKMKNTLIQIPQSTNGNSNK